MKQTVHTREWLPAWGHITAAEKDFSGTAYLHMHDYFELELVLGGSGVQDINGERYDLGRGTVYLLAPTDVHQVVPSVPMRIINVSFDHTMLSAPLLNHLTSRSAPLILRMNEEKTAEAEFLARLCVRDLGHTDKLSRESRRALLASLLILILRADGEAIAATAGSDPGPIDRGLRYLIAHFRENPSLERVAAECGYSPNWFSSQFHEVTGKKYIDFLTSLKLKNAEMLLTTTGKTVLEIANLCGFYSLSNFNRVFRRETGSTPTQYRNAK